MVGKRPSEVAHAAHDHGPDVGDAERLTDLEPQEGGVVADAAGAVGAEVRQVLADLGGVDTGEIGEFVGRHCCRHPDGERVEAAEVQRESSHGGFGDPTKGCHHPTLDTLCMSSQEASRVHKWATAIPDSPATA